ncbi:MAG: anti-sigma factor family protein [Planctomycetota bacterium]
MNCEWVCRHLDAYELGLLDPAERGRLEAHLAACAACRARLEAARETDRAVQEALGWANPGPAFADRVMRAASQPRRPWRRVVAAVVAAAACFVIFYALYRPPEGPPPPPEQEPTVSADLVSGEVMDVLGQARGRLEGGRAYLAWSDAAVAGERGLFLIPSGTTFEPGAGEPVALSVHAGALLGQVDRGEEPVSVELVPTRGGAQVRTQGCQFYTTAVPPDNGGSEAIGVHVFAGTLELAVGGRTVTLARGDSAIVAGGRVTAATPQMEAEVARLREALGADLLAERRRLQGRPEAYATLREAHPRLAELDAAEAALGRLASVADTAGDELGRMVMASAR